MPEIISLDIKELSPKALQVLKAAVSIGIQHEVGHKNRVRIEDFCRLAQLPSDTNPLEFIKLYLEAQKALGVLDVTDENGELVEDYASWQLLEDCRYSREEISFRICRPLHIPELSSALINSTALPLSKKNHKKTSS